MASSIVENACFPDGNEIPASRYRRELILVRTHGSCNGKRRVIDPDSPVALANTINLHSFIYTAIQITTRLLSVSHISWVRFT